MRALREGGKVITTIALLSFSPKTEQGCRLFGHLKPPLYRLGVHTSEPSKDSYAYLESRRIIPGDGAQFLEAWEARKKRLPMFQNLACDLRQFQIKICK